jgi:hypothetical protein
MKKLQVLVATCVAVVVILSLYGVIFTHLK